MTRPIDPTRRRVLSAAAAVGWATAGGLASSPARADELQVGRPAPPLVLRTLDGRSIATSDLKGQVVILTFWATWCAPCREELPVLSDYAQRHATRGLQVLGFSLDDAGALAQVRSVASTLSFPVGLLGSAWAGGYGRMWRLPVSFAIDRDGRLAYNGWDDEHPALTQARLHALVDPLLR